MPIPEIFSQKALEIVPRVLGFCDREPDSPTFGCCDRNYWHYRLTDLSNARFQEAGFLFALAYALPLPQNHFHKNERLLSWIRGVWAFWLARRNRDGSVSEVYPHERSFCATAFSAAAFLETVRLTGGPGAWGRELDAARATVEWLEANRQGDTANQMAASLLAITAYAGLTREARWAEAARRRADDVRKLADADGGFHEYGGWDTGYQSIAMSLLARVSAIGADGTWTELLHKGEKLLAKRIGPSGEVESSLNSRCTQFVYPYSLAVLKSGLLDSLANGLQKNRLLCPAWMDDRYAVQFASDYWMASEEFLKC